MNSLADIRGALDDLPRWTPSAVSVDYLETVDSTNSELKRRLAAGRLDGATVLVTDHQSAGRGTHGRGWVQQAGRDLAVSLAVDGGRPGFHDPRLPLAIGAAAALSLEQSDALSGPPAGWAGLRWPNDLCAGDPPLKFGGLLTERSRGWVIIGIGLNVNSTIGDLGPELSTAATTLREFLGAEVDRLTFAAEFIAALLHNLGLAGTQVQKLGINALLAEWQAHDRTAGKRYRLASSGELVVARSVDIDTGELQCTTDGGRAVRVRSYSELQTVPHV